MDKEIKKYKVTIMETIEKGIVIEAENEKAAISKVEEMYNNSEISFDENCLHGIEIGASIINDKKKSDITVEELQELLDGNDCIDEPNM